MTFADKDKKIGEWSELKLEFLKSYLNKYLDATNKAIHKYYIDCFAGYKQYTSTKSGKKIPGSCEISLSFDKKFTKYFFIEMDKKRVKELTQLRKSHIDCDIEIYEGDCNQEIKKIMPSINKRSPTFVFLDTDGINIEWNTIEYLSNWKTELLINFPFNMSIKRSMPTNKLKLKESQKQLINKFYGTDKWQNIYYNAQSGSIIERNHNLVNLYINRIKKLGYKYVILSEKFRNSKGAPLYYLVFASNHYVGEKIMKHVFTRQFQKQQTIWDYL